MNSWTWCSTMLRITKSDHSWLGNSSCIAALNFFDESRASYLSLGKSRYLQLCPLAKQCCSLTWWMVQKTNTASIHFLAYPPVSSCTWLVLSCWTLQGWLNHQPVLYGRHRCTHLDVGAPGRGGVGTGTGAGANGFEWLWYGFSWFFCICFFLNEGLIRGWYVFFGWFDVVPWILSSQSRFLWFNCWVFNEVKKNGFWTVVTNQVGFLREWNRHRDLPSGEPGISQTQAMAQTKPFDVTKTNDDLDNFCVVHWV